MLLHLAAALALIPSALDDDPGHSHQGSAFDSGMRTRPWRIKGVGEAPFPITSKSREVQAWFNQGNALLHSFWFEEAERTFRWCLKLDPDCAMAYWGLARSGFTWFEASRGNLDDKLFDRYKAFLKEAVKRKNHVTERERDFIEVWEKGFADKVTNRAQRLTELLKALVAKYPDDIEAKALLGLFGIGQLKPAEDQAILDQVLAKNPLHPGALHASIHNWDDSDAVKAVPSSRLYGKAAPGVGHALHMPGHIFSKVGMWHEAAIAMDSATRTELRYMNDRLALPYEDWDYAHNRNYLCYIQEQLGMVDASLQGARDLLAAPRDRDVRGYEFRAEREGFKALLRALIKFERWDDILAAGGVPWTDGDDNDRRERPVAELLALTGLGRLAEARGRLNKLKADKSTDTGLLFKVAEAKLRIAEGDTPGGIKELRDAAENDYYGGDPPNQPWPVKRLIGDACLASGDAKGAITAYGEALKREPNDGFSLAGLTKAYHQVGDQVHAERFAGRLAYEWSDADPNLKWLKEAHSLGLKVKPVAETVSPERRYDPNALRSFGPSNWRPFPAPRLTVTGADGKSSGLDEYRGKNVILIFYLGDSCVHCVEQLETINRRMSDFEKRNTVVLAACSAKPSKLRESKALGDVHITLVSDRNHESARRFASYDDFENLELHSTILLDSAGNVRWKRTGGDPFSDVDFLLKQIDHVNATPPR
ncbi:MAG TPA: redoxin domain-containing protein [Fimbriimonadaceae bacterium]|nr:redoxin domain-containing protein [Fimbriimonadaceae bacterium]